MKVEIIADSKNLWGDRITTFKLVFPRYILAELNTHRAFSKNSASSRAIPFKKMVKMVEENPFIPMAWQKDHKGMQGDDYFTNKDDIEFLKDFWLEARNHAVDKAKILNEPNCFIDGLGLTKQMANRLLEPFMWHTVLLTTTGEGLQNFFELRCPQYEYSPNMKYFKSKKDWIKYANIYEGTRLTQETDMDWLYLNKGQADIHMMALAEMMYDAYNESSPKELGEGDWHIPMGETFDEKKIISTWRKLSKIPGDYIQDTKIKIATARCARISYETLGDEPKIDYEADLKLYQTLLDSGHYSPFEHCARAMDKEEAHTYYRGSFVDNGERIHKYADNKRWCRNFRGFIQHRELL